MNFQPFCCKCFSKIDLETQRNGTFVFSCGDYLCQICSSDIKHIKDCPGCGKSNVKSLALGGNLPIEVEQSMSDIQVTLQELQAATTFQIKYYKQTISLMAAQEIKTSRQAKSINETNNSSSNNKNQINNNNNNSNNNKNNNSSSSNTQVGNTTTNNNSSNNSNNSNNQLGNNNDISNSNSNIDKSNYNHSQENNRNQNNIESRSTTSSSNYYEKNVPPSYTSSSKNQGNVENSTGMTSIYNPSNSQSLDSRPSSRPKSTSSIVSKHFPVPVNFESRIKNSNSTSVSSNISNISKNSSNFEVQAYSQPINRNIHIPQFPQPSHNESYLPSEYRPSSSQSSISNGSGNAYLPEGPFGSSQSGNNTASARGEALPLSLPSSQNRVNQNELFKSPSSRLSTPIPSRLGTSQSSSQLQGQSIISPSRIRSPHMNIVRGPSNSGHSTKSTHSSQSNLESTLPFGMFKGDKFSQQSSNGM